MKKLLAILLLLSGAAFGQLGNLTLKHYPGAATGSCGRNQVAVNDSNGDFYSCDTSTGAWVLVSGGGGGGISGLTTGFIPKAASATSIANSLCDEGITTANTVTCTDTGGIAAPALKTTGSNGGLGSVEGTGVNVFSPAGGTGLAGSDSFWPDSTAHRWKMNNNNGGAVQVVASGGDINTSDQVTVTHLAAALPVNQGGTGTASTLTGLMRGNASAMTAAELSGDVTTSGSNAATIAANAVTGAKMANSTVTATQLAAQYSKGSCTELWGGSGTSFALTAGDDAVSNNSCYNDSGVTRTITAVKCRSDNASNTTTVNPTFGAAGTGTTILSGALTCGSSLAYSSTGTVSNSGWTTGTGITPAMSGTLTGTSIAMIVEYTF